MAKSKSKVAAKAKALPRNLPGPRRLPDAAVTDQALRMRKLRERRAAARSAAAAPAGPATCATCGFPVAVDEASAYLDLCCPASCAALGVVATGPALAVEAHRAGGRREVRP